MQNFQQEINRLSLIPDTDQEFAIDALMAIADLLQVQRTSLWLLDESSQAISCRNLIDKERGMLIEASTLYEKDYPQYFKALKSGQPIIAQDARKNVTTKEFTDIYLIPFNIVSMLDLPVFVDNQLVGIICCEHCGEKRPWLAQEQAFVRQIAALIGIRLANKCF